MVDIRRSEYESFRDTESGSTYKSFSYFRLRYEGDDANIDNALLVGMLMGAKQERLNLRKGGFLKEGCPPEMRENLKKFHLGIIGKVALFKAVKYWTTPPHLLIEDKKNVKLLN